jgi:CitMHS family citrate-Mg2+:H+ or citrate-Ca2+:H+ symporter
VGTTKVVPAPHIINAKPNIKDIKVMYLQTAYILGTITLIIVASMWLLKLRIELAMILAAIGGMLVGGFGFQVRHLVEGSFSFFDIMLTIISATIFLNILKESGILYAIVRSMVIRFHRQRVILLILLMLMLLLPGALTGAGTVSVLVSGGIVAIVLKYMGVSILNTSVIVFIGAAMSVVAPPINVYAMIIGSGITMPYIGFFVPLAVPILAVSIFTVLFLGLRGTPIVLEKVLEELPDAPVKMRGFKIYLPFLFLIGLMVASRVIPHVMPILGTPLQFILSTVLALVIIYTSGERVHIIEISRMSLQQLFPLLATLVAVGVLVQVLTLTGVRGLFVITIFSLPLILVYLALVIGLPLGEAVLVFGVAAVLGVPTVLYFAQLGFNPIIVTSGISLIIPLGDALPPSAVIGRITITTVGYTGSYGSFLKRCIVPWIVISLTGIGMVIFANFFSSLLLY